MSEVQKYMNLVIKFNQINHNTEVFDLCRVSGMSKGIRKVQIIDNELMKVYIIPQNNKVSVRTFDIHYRTSEYLKFLNDVEIFMSEEDKEITIKKAKQILGI